MAVTSVVLVLVGVIGPVHADEPYDDDDRSPTTTEVVRRGIIPEPDSGRPPQDAGDRGGAAQLALFGLVLLGVAAISGLAVRESRRARANRT